MKPRFISDIHLSEDNPHLTDAFKLFLNESKKTCTHLFILGDLFEIWIGDDDDNLFIQDIKKALIDFTSDGPETFLMHGNRDFLVTKSICKDLKINLLDDPTVIEIDNMKILLMHGDTLCTDDHEYQNFRSMVRSSAWQKEMLSKSLEERLSIANSLRSKSIEANRLKGEEIMDVNNAAVMNIIEKYKPDVIIHGHTHRPNIHLHNEVTRYVLCESYNKILKLTYDKD